MKYFNLFLLEKGKKRYVFESQFFFSERAKLIGERFVNDSFLKTIYVSFKVVPTNKRRPNFLHY